MESLIVFNEDLESLICASPFPIAVFDEAGGYRYTNAAGAAFGGYALKEHAGKTIYDVLPDVAGHVHELIRQVIGTGRSITTMIERGDSAAHIVTYFPFRSHPSGEMRVGLVFLPMRYVDESSPQIWRRRMAFESLVSSASSTLLAASPETFEPSIAEVLGAICEAQQYAGAALVRVVEGRDTPSWTCAWDRHDRLGDRPRWLTSQLLSLARERERTTLRLGELHALGLSETARLIAGEFPDVDQVRTYPFSLDTARAGFVVFLVPPIQEYEAIVDRRLRTFADLLASALSRHEKDAALASALASTSRQRQVALQERDYLREEVERDFDVSTIVHTSDAMKSVIELARVVGATPTTALLCGESGVGKELVARAIHQASPRRDKPLVKVNCASIPRELFESEFFGHTRGSFTSAVRDRVGRFELAHGGTLFLDEVGEIPLAEQAKLLRVLQEGEFERVGDDRTRRVDVRIVAATNKNLELAVDEGTFRRDLYFRLGVVPIVVPALRDRRDDVVPLAEHFLSIHSKRVGRKGLHLSDADRERLTVYGWPGNVRELSNVVERSVILAKDGRLRILLPDAPHSGPPASPWSTATFDAEPTSSIARSSVGLPSSLSALRDVEKALIDEALKASGGKNAGKQGAAARLGLSPSTLRHRIKRRGLG